MTVTFKSLGFIGFPQYRVGDNGTVWNCRYGYWRKKTPKESDSGHLYVSLYKENKMKWYPIHHLVLLAFVGPRPQGMEARHFPDRNPANNRPENLQWGTHTENNRDRATHKTLPIGSSHANSKLDDQGVRWVHHLRNRGWTLKRIARLFDVSHQLILGILQGKSWKHVRPIAS